MLHFTSVEFHNFKAFQNFSLRLKQFNVMVGPNNAGKSTILAAFRILAAGLRRANNRKPSFIRYNGSPVRGYDIDLSTISVAEENIFFNYNDDNPALVRFRLSNASSLLLYFPERETCYLIPEPIGRPIETPSTFKKQFDCPISFVPILGPVEHNEPLFEKEAARLALFSYRAARNFRNIWYHYPEEFANFRSMLTTSWPGMDIQAPEIDSSHSKPRLHMYCPEQRIPRELFWSGFGFQVWYQMLTHIIQGRESSIFLIDEPDIYLHSDLQRQLVNILRDLGPDILIATHSTEIITECDGDDLVLISKTRKQSKRLKNQGDVALLLKSLGSSINPILTQLAKTKRALFVEGKDFQIIGRFAHKLGRSDVGNRRDFAVVPVEGFNPERIRTLVKGIETTLGSGIISGIVLDRDFRSQDECASVAHDCSGFSQFSVVHSCKEIENFVLVSEAIDRAIKARLDDKTRRGGTAAEFQPLAEVALERFSADNKIYIQSRYIADRKRFDRVKDPKLSETTINEAALVDFESSWQSREKRLQLIPGKEALAFVNSEAQRLLKVSVTPAAIIDAMRLEEVSAEMKTLVALIGDLASTSPTD